MEGSLQKESDTKHVNRVEEELGALNRYIEDLAAVTEEIERRTQLVRLDHEEKTGELAGKEPVPPMCPLANRIKTSANDIRMFVGRLQHILNTLDI